MQEPLAQIGEESNNVLVVGRHEDPRITTLGPHLFFRDEFDLHALPRPFGVAVVLFIDGNRGVNRVANELTEGHAETVPVENAVFVGLGEFLGIGDAGPGFIRTAMLDHDAAIIGLAFQGLHLSGLGREFEPVIAAKDDRVQLGPKQDIQRVFITRSELANGEWAVVVG